MSSPCPAVLLVTPTFNERENLEELAERVFGLVEDLDLLVVDDDSPDGTAELCRTARVPGQRPRSGDAGGSSRPREPPIPDPVLSPTLTDEVVERVAQPVTRH